MLEAKLARLKGRNEIHFDAKDVDLATLDLPLLNAYIKGVDLANAEPKEDGTDAADEKDKGDKEPEAAAQYSAPVKIKDVVHELMAFAEKRKVKEVALMHALRQLAENTNPIQPSSGDPVKDIIALNPSLYHSYVNSKSNPHHTEEDVALQYHILMESREAKLERTAELVKLLQQAADQYGIPQLAMQQGHPYCQMYIDKPSSLGPHIKTPQQVVQALIQDILQSERSRELDQHLAAVASSLQTSGNIRI